MKRRNRKKLSTDEISEAQEEMNFFLELRVVQIFPEAKDILPETNLHAYGRFMKHADQVLTECGIKTAPL